MTRVLMRWVCRALIGAMLFAQMAVAAYACPRLSDATERSRQAFAAEATPDTAMTVPDGKAIASDNAAVVAQAMDCEHMATAMDPASPNLCAQHCQQGHRSDQASTITVPPVLLASLYALAPPSETMPVPPAPGAQPGVLVAASPPHSILHCCLRD